MYWTVLDIALCSTFVTLHGLFSLVSFALWKVQSSILTIIKTSLLAGKAYPGSTPDKICQLNENEL